MSEPYIGEIRMFAGNFAPRGWALCNGALMSIAQNTALFSILGTTFGGNGQTTFALPDLQGRVPMHWGSGPGLPNVALGQMAGEVSHTLITSEMPMHTHPASGTNNDADNGRPGGGVLAINASPNYTAAHQPDAPMNPAMIGAAGGNQPHNNMQPYTAITFIIALEGIYPPRN